jgi:hypothetical protein
VQQPQHRAKLDLVSNRAVRHLGHGIKVRPRATSRQPRTYPRNAPAVVPDKAVMRVGSARALA